jgi:diguanylate cyclase (GGDEF)-like protein
MILKDALESLKSTLAPFIALQRELENLEKAARLDDKTPLLNGLAMSEAEEKFAASDESPNVVVFADINKFKSVNTEYGQYAGDVAIEKVGELINTELVESCGAQAFHISGDEFVLLLNQNSLEQLKLKTDSFKNCAVSFLDSSSEQEIQFIVKVSFGIALNDNVSDFRTLRSRAELACKKAKTLGGGKFFEWTEELERSRMEELRETCHKCGTITECNVPTDKKEIKSILRCPNCQISFAEN